MLKNEGILAVKKEKGMTSHDVVSKMRRLFATRAVGHTGTLDPMAEGVLVVMIGRATKCERFLVSDSKEYVAGMQLGIRTDTEDTTGTVISASERLPTSEETKKAALSFLGEYDQTPPMYSAVKIDGKKLYEYAREGKEIERKSRRVRIDSIECTCNDEGSGDYTLVCSVSSGTYIRTLCADIGEKLGCGAAMSGLVRTRAGKYTLDDCTTISALAEMEYEDRLALLTPPEKALTGEKVTLPAFYERLYVSGCEIYLKKLSKTFPEGTNVLVYNERGDFISYGTVRDYPQGLAIKSNILFV